MQRIIAIFVNLIHILSPVEIFLFLQSFENFQTIFEITIAQGQVQGRTEFDGGLSKADLVILE